MNKRGQVPLSFLYLQSALVMTLIFVSDARAADFTGRWLYEGRAEMDGKSYRVVDQFDLMQQGTRVCGCWNRTGAPSDKVELRAVAGSVSNDILDLYANGGSGAHPPEEYTPSYPFEPEVVERLQYRQKGLYRAILGDEKKIIQKGFPPPSATRYHEDEFVLRRKTNKFNRGEVCGGEDFRRFLRACLLDRSEKNQND